MGAADIVPGVSGGTIAFITGIYEELLKSISSINFKMFNLLKNKNIKSVWHKINGISCYAYFPEFCLVFSHYQRLLHF